MGFYIEVPNPINKASQIKTMYDADEVEFQYLDKVLGFNGLPKDKSLVCVVQNGMFDAAGIVFNENEYRAFSSPEDPRRKTWLLMDTKKVIELCPHVAGYLTHDN